MTLILIDGGPASGKNTLGALLVKKFKKPGNKIILLDLDVCIEKINPSWVWEDKEKERLEKQKARENFAQDIDRYLQQGFSVIAIGERFLTKDDIADFIKRLKVTFPTFYLYHLNPPFETRKKRLAQRGPCSLIDLEKDQSERDSNAKWYGYVYENINSPIEDAEIIMRLIQNDEGLLNATLF
jgi:predicted kinase